MLLSLVAAGAYSFLPVFFSIPGEFLAGISAATGIAFDVAFTSALKRAQSTLAIILAELGLTTLPIHEDARLNERDYGELSGLNKDDARKRWGEKQVHVWRRSYDVRPPGGEKSTGARYRRIRACS